MHVGHLRLRALMQGLREGEHAARFSQAVLIARRERVSRGGHGLLFSRLCGALTGDRKSCRTVMQLACSEHKLV